MGTVADVKPDDKAKAKATRNKKNGHHPDTLAAPHPGPILALILASLQTMRDGDFSVRLPGTGPGWRAKSPTPSTRSSPPTSRWRRS